MLSRAIEMWREAFNVPPQYSRQGTLSASDSRFWVLADLGFRGGSVSLPGRVFPDKHAVWAGAPLDPHRGHPDFRLLEGPLEFANMPISVDTSQLNEKDGRQFYWDLRPDFDGLDYLQMARNIVAQLRERDPAIPCINMLTHNDYDFADPESRVGRNYRDVLAAIKAACDEANIKAVGATLGEIVDEVLSEPYVAPEFDKSGGRVFLNVDDRPR